MPAPAATDELEAKLSRALGSQYELGHLLGRGGMGAVYFAREPFLERSVAVKVLTTDSASDEARERFLREARIAARLSHPHIVPLHTFGQADNLLYYVMGYVDGEPLEARLRREGRLPADEVQRIVSELADALDYAHKAGVVHRDVKPDNVLLDRSTGRAMLTDFGVARPWAGVETLTVTGAVIGTPHYMSPEQASGDRSIDGRSDIYALGVIAYRMATGRLPFAGETFREVLVQHVTHVPLSVTKLVDGFPFDLDRAIERALEKDPSSRWRTAGELKAALTPNSEESVPEELQPLAGYGVRMGLAFAALVDGWLVGSLTGFLEPAARTFLGYATLFAGVLMGVGLVHPARRFGWRRVLRQAFRQPGWWESWWPRALRRPGDVWDRLPSVVRRGRVVVGLSNIFGVTALHVLALIFMLIIDGNPLLGAMMAIWAAMVVGMAFIYRNMRRIGRAAGLTKLEIHRLGAEPTWNAAFWSKPHVAALLAHSPQAPQFSAAKEPEALIRQIENLASSGSGSPHADIYGEAVAAARAIGEALARSDAELAQLSKDADPRERERIEGRLAALGPAGSNETPAKAQMRDLLERQLRLLQEMDERKRDVGSLRSRFHEQLRTLALQLARLRLDGMDDPSSSEDTMERIRVLMRDIELRLQATQEVRQMLG